MSPSITVNVSSDPCGSKVARQIGRLGQIENTGCARSIIRSLAMAASKPDGSGFARECWWLQKCFAVRLK